MVEIDFSPEFERWFLALNDSDTEAVARVVDLLEARGVALGYPYTSAIVGSANAMRELRVQSGGRPLRIPYTFDPKRRGIFAARRREVRWRPILSADHSDCGGNLPAAFGRRISGVLVGAGDNRTMSKWQALKARKMTPAQIDKVNKEVADELLQMDLRELRETLGITQNEMANLLKKAQPEISRLEHRSDFHVSTLQRYVSALGGELEIVANFGNRRVRLR